MTAPLDAWSDVASAAVGGLADLVPAPGGGALVGIANAVASVGLGLGRMPAPVPPSLQERLGESSGLRVPEVVHAAPEPLAEHA